MTYTCIPRQTNKVPHVLCMHLYSTILKPNFSCTYQILESSLQQAVQLAPSHISVYDLIVEEGTSFGRWFGPLGLSPKGEKS